ncbi:hypothetical protein JZ751_022360 [Albula glossodonta]|uniref:Uncharacterized protein n=1 Tax=Albula glossodonta TaxID=121402 RepID=A0A8T2NJI3_9TELE|nr:hypothetical protein JZ751_022360 [Albula glossodonta]
MLVKVKGSSTLPRHEVEPANPWIDSQHPRSRLSAQLFAQSSAVWSDTPEQNLFQVRSGTIRLTPHSQL